METYRRKTILVHYVSQTNKLINVELYLLKKIDTT